MTRRCPCRRRTRSAAGRPAGTDRPGRRALHEVGRRERIPVPEHQYSSIARLGGEPGRRRRKREDSSGDRHVGGEHEVAAVRALGEQVVEVGLARSDARVDECETVDATDREVGLRRRLQTRTLERGQSAVEDGGGVDEHRGVGGGRGLRCRQDAGERVPLLRAGAHHGAQLPCGLREPDGVGSAEDDGWAARCAPAEPVADGLADRLPPEHDPRRAVGGDAVRCGLQQGDVIDHDDS